MKTVSLRTLVRDPVKVKRMTRAGQPVQVTDDGEPLWIIQAADAASQDPVRDQEIDGLLDEVLGLPPSAVSLAGIVIGARR